MIVVDFSEYERLWARPCPRCGQPPRMITLEEGCCGFELRQCPMEWGGGWYWVEIEEEED